jgi:hypothetical protein
LNAEEIHERLVQPLEPLTDEEIDLIVNQLQIECAKINRLANHLLNRPRGISIHALQSLDQLKTSVSWLKWHWEKSRLRGDDGKPEAV